MKNVRVFLKKGEEDAIFRGCPWIFDNEIAFVRWHIAGENKQSEFAKCPVPDGSCVEVFSRGGIFVGAGVLNKKSKIPVRILAFKKSDDGNYTFNSAFFERRFKAAADLRKQFFGEKESCRVVFGEADFVPGFIADKFVTCEGKIVLSVQFLTLGAEMFRDAIVDAAKTTFSPDGIFERSDAPVRKLEGLELEKGWIVRNGGLPEDGKIVIEENGVKLSVDLQNGQKTGYFLDQKWNRAALARLASGKTVLDLCSYSGGFALNAFAGGAKNVVAVESSESAVEMIKKNVALNHAENCVSTLCGDVFDVLREKCDAGELYDVVVLDPPAFTKNARSAEKAFGGYKELNLRAIKLLHSGGILLTCSCSRFFDAQRFYAMLESAACDAKKKLQILQKCGAAPDHPVLAGYEASEYLTCAICRVV